MQALPNHTCPLCGGPNGCAPAQAGTLDVECWCTHARIPPEVLAQIPPAQRRQACICASCATAGHTDSDSDSDSDSSKAD